MRQNAWPDANCDPLREKVCINVHFPAINNGKVSLQFHSFSVILKEFMSRKVKFQENATKFAKFSKYARLLAKYAKKL